MKSITKSIEIFKFNLTSLIKNKSMFIYLSLFFIMAFVLIVVLLPYRYAGGPVIITYLVLPLFVIIGWTGYNLRNSTLYSNVSITGVRKSSFYLGQILTLLVIGNILSLIFFMTVFLLSPFEIWSSNWGVLQPDPISVNPFANGAWINIIYITEITSLLTFSIYFLFHSWFKSEKFYYIIVVGLYLLGIIFGGALNNYFGTPWWYATIDGNRLSAELTEVNLTQAQFDKLVFGTFCSKGQMKISYNLFPTELFGATLLYPFFGIGQFTTTAIFAHATSGEYYSANAIINVYDTIDASGVGDTLINQYNLYDLTGGGVSWNYFSISFTSETWQWTMIIWQPYIYMITSFIIGVLISKYKNK